jgi:hypothetical protein
MRFLNLLANKFFGMLFTWLLKQRFRDTLCGTKMLSRKHYELLAANRVFFGNFDPFGDFDLIFGSVKQNFKELIRYECPAQISRDKESEIMETARKIYKVLGCRDFARIDFRLSAKGILYFIEINPLPGLAPGYSDFPMIAAFNGVEYVALVRAILKSALKRHGLSRCYEQVRGNEK